MKICANCGAQLPDDAAFCNNCGSSLADSTSAAPAAATTSGEAAPQPEQQTAPTVSLQKDSQQSQFEQPAYQQPQYQQAQYQQAPYQQPQYQQPYAAYDPKDHTAEFDPQDIAENKLFAILPYLFSCVLGIIGIYVKDSAYVKFHIKNSIRFAIASILVLLLMIIPFLGWIAAAICEAVLGVVKIIAIVWAFQGKAKELPIISSIGFLK